MLPENVGGQSKITCSCGGSRLESRESAQPALCEMIGEGRLQESVSRVTCRGIFLFDYCSLAVTLRAARGTGLVSRRNKFCRVVERSSCVRVGNREGFTGTWRPAGCTAVDLGGTAALGGNTPCSRTFPASRT
jgi:hypothetical protein